MSNRTRTFICLIVCVFGALVIGCAPNATPATPAPIPVTASATSTPVPVATPLSPVALEMIKTVQAFEDARNRGDTDAHVALVTFAKQELFRGKAEHMVGMGVQKEIADCTATDDRVICKGKMRSGVLPCGFSELQFASVEYVFRNGKIDTATYSYSQDSYSADYPFQKALMTYVAKNHPELLNDMGKLTREGGALMVTMTREYCAVQK